MLHKVQAYVLTIGLAVVLGSGCQSGQRNLPSTADQGAKMDRTRQKRQTHWQQMADNALLSDMSVYDSHFIPHSSELSATGVDRLSRMAVYLDTYGGKVRYDTLSSDEDLVQKRLDNVGEFLEASGADVSRVEVIAGLSGGRMLAARAAIQVADKGTAKPQGEGSSPLIVGPSPNP